MTDETPESDEKAAMPGFDPVSAKEIEEMLADLPLSEEEFVIARRRTKIQRDTMSEHLKLVAALAKKMGERHLAYEVERLLAIVEEVGIERPLVSEIKPVVEASFPQAVKRTSFSPRGRSRRAE